MSKFFTPFRSLKERWHKLSIAERGAIAINIPLLCLIFSFGGHLFVRQDVNILVIILDVAIGCIGVAIAKRLFKDLATELQARESLLQESNNLIRAVFGNVVDGVVTLDDRGRIESCNQAAIAMFGYELSTLIGQNWNMLLGNQNQEPIPIPTPATIEAGEMGFACRVTFANFDRRGLRDRNQTWRSDRKSTRLNSSHRNTSRMPSSA